MERPANCADRQHDKTVFVQSSIDFVADVQNFPRRTRFHNCRRDFQKKKFLRHVWNVKRFGKYFILIYLLLPQHTDMCSLSLRLINRIIHCTYTNRILELQIPISANFFFNSTSKSSLESSANDDRLVELFRSR